MASKNETVHHLCVQFRTVASLFGDMVACDASAEEVLTGKMSVGDLAPGAAGTGYLEAAGMTAGMAAVMAAAQADTAAGKDFAQAGTIVVQADTAVARVGTAVAQTGMAAGTAVV